MNLQTLKQMVQWLILIESQWNLNYMRPADLLYLSTILIESQWNLNIISRSTI